MARALQDDDDGDDDATVEMAGEASFDVVRLAAVAVSASTSISMPPRRLPIDQAFDQSIRNSPFYEPHLSAAYGVHHDDDDDDLAALLDRVDVVSGDGRPTDEEDADTEKDAEGTDNSSAMGNSVLRSAVGWSSADGAVREDGDRDDDADDGGDDDESAVSTTFSTLVAKHRRQMGDEQRALNPAEVWQRFESSLVGGEDDVQSDEVRQPETVDDAQVEVQEEV